MSLRADWDASRRLFILRLLIETGDEANESNIYRATQHGGFARDTRDDIRRDLDHLKRVGCTSEQWFNGSVRVVRITERGREAAYGKVEVDGVEKSTWDR